MRKVLIILLLLAFSGFIVGCSSSVSENEITLNTYALDEINDIDSLPKNIVEKIDILTKQRGYAVIKSGENEHILIIALGEKNTGGYDVINPEIEEKNGNILITFTEFKSDGLVTQVISYPYKAYYLRGEVNDLNDIKVENNNGNIFDIIKIVEAKGLYLGQIDPHSIEIEMDGEVRAFQIVNILDKFNSMKLSERTAVEFTYIENEKGELIITELK